MRFNCDQRAKHGQVGAGQQVWVLRSRVFAECDLTSDASRRSAPSAGPGPEVPGEMTVWRRGGATGIQQPGAGFASWRLVTCSFLGLPGPQY